MLFPFESPERFSEFWFEGRNPAAVKCMREFRGSMDEARRAVEKVVREEYEGGKGICTWAVLGVGRKG